MLRTKKVLTSILIEVTGGLVRQVASKCLQEAKIQKSKYVFRSRKNDHQSLNDRIAKFASFCLKNLNLIIFFIKLQP